MTFFLNMVVNGILVGAMYSLVAVGIVIIYKSSRVFNFAVGEIIIFGAYIFWLIMVPLGLPLWVAFLGFVIYGVLLGLLAERLVLRPLVGQPFLAQVMATLALSSILGGIYMLLSENQVRWFPEIIPTEPFVFGDIRFQQTFVWGFVISLICLGIFAAFFKFSRAGLSMRVAAEGHQIARSLGVRTSTVFSQSWIIAILLGGIVGILMACLYGISPFLSAIGLKSFAVVLFGGLESLVGAVIAGPIIGVLENLTGGYIDPLIGGGLKDVAPFIILIVTLIFMPYGLFGLKRIERI